MKKRTFKRIVYGGKIRFRIPIEQLCSEFHIHRNKK